MCIGAWEYDSQQGNVRENTDVTWYNSGFFLKILCFLTNNPFPWLLAFIIQNPLFVTCHHSIKIFIKTAEYGMCFKSSNILSFIQLIWDTLTEIFVLISELDIFTSLRYSHAVTQTLLWYVYEAFIKELPLKFHRQDFMIVILHRQNSPFYYLFSEHTLYCLIPYRLFIPCYDDINMLFGTGLNYAVWNIFWLTMN